MQKKNKILLYDIETSPLITYNWALYDERPIAMEQDWQLLTFSYKFLGEKEVFGHTRLEFKDKTDKSLTKKLWRVLNSADVLVGHNSISFDSKKSNAKFAEYDLPPIKCMQIDTKKIAKSLCNFTSNSLDALGKLLGCGEKKKHSGFDMWKKCMRGDKKAFAEMLSYNKMDVILLEKIYMKLRRYGRALPNASLLETGKMGCAACGNSKIVSKGVWVTEKTIQEKYSCSKKNCGYIFVGRRGLVG
jgi:DNA polymerase III epsilon subunit-like protein